MNERLSRANEQLKDHALAIEELTITKERNRIARDAHDTLGHTMTLLIALIEVGVILCDQNPAETKARLVEAARIARDGLKELRGSINRAAEAKNLIESLKKLFSDFAGSGMKVDFSVDGGNNALSPRYTNAIFRICQEALTNALRHGKANLTSVFLRFDEHSVKLYIFDNGTGCAGIVKGMGLAGMEQRVSELNGKIEYGSGGDHGFNLNIELPV
jgi:signal transduction histidine kinase